MPFAWDNDGRTEWLDGERSATDRALAVARNPKIGAGSFQEWDVHLPPGACLVDGYAADIEGDGRADLEAILPACAG